MNIFIIEIKILTEPKILTDNLQRCFIIKLFRYLSIQQILVGSFSMLVAECHFQIHILRQQFGGSNLFNKISVPRYIWYLDMSVEIFTRRSTGRMEWMIESLPESRKTFGCSMRIESCSNVKEIERVWATSEVDDHERRDSS